MQLNLTNVFSAPLSLHRYRLGGLLLQDVDGVRPRSVLMAATKFHADFQPNASHQLAADMTSALTPVVLKPGEYTSAKATVPMHWESVVRYMDEMYMKDQNCIAVQAGRADIVLQGPPAAAAAGGGSATAGGSAASAPPAPPPAVALTLGFSPRGMGTWKRRACHLPATCLPATQPLLAGGCTSASCAVRGSARLVGGPGGPISLVSQANPQKRQAGAAFASGPKGVAAPLLDGFRADFEFEARRACTSTVWGWCKPLSGGFAFVLAASASGGSGDPGDDPGDDPGTASMASASSAFTPPPPPPPPLPLGHACEVTAAVVQDGQTCPAVPGLVMNNLTTISCSGYAGVGHSVGVVFSLASGPVGNRYWSVAAPIVSSLSDWPRGSLSLYVNGVVKNTTSLLGPARGISQHGGQVPFTQGAHNATVRYSPATRMLYVHLDGEPAPSLVAELDPADLGLGEARPMLTPGFTATGPESGEGLSIDIRRWSLEATRAVAAASQLLEDGQIVGAARREAAVHIDARDSCGLPRVGGGLAWAVRLTEAASGAAVAVHAIDDLGDGTYRVRFTGERAGLYRLTATLQPAGDPGDDGGSGKGTLSATVELAPPLTG